MSKLEQTLKAEKVTCSCGAVIGSCVQVLTHTGPQVWLTLTGSEMALERVRGRCPRCRRDWAYNACSLLQWQKHAARRAQRH